MNYSIQRQLSVAIENQPGRLAAVSRAMADHGINIQDISIVDNVEQGMIRFVTNDPERCKTLLLGQGLYVVEAEVLVIDLPGAPGQLAVVSQALADAKINIDYAYGSEDPAGNRMRLVLKVSNAAKAIETIAALSPA